jgi:hypothetical protein
VTCRTIATPGGGLAIVCDRNRGHSRRVILCDGCDQKLDPRDTVSPKKNLDFCPTCARAAFVHWLKDCGGRGYDDHPRDQRRTAFRTWAIAHPAKFLELSKPRTAASLAEIP